MSALLRSLTWLAIDLYATHTPFALAGCLGAIARGADPRTTRGIEIVSTDSVEVIAGRLGRRGYQAAGSRSLLTRLPPRLLVTILDAHGREGLILATSEPLDLCDGLIVPVASRAALIALALRSGDPLDKMDAHGLLMACTEGELWRARELCGESLREEFELALRTVRLAQPRTPPFAGREGRWGDERQG